MVMLDFDAAGKLASKDLYGELIAYHTVCGMESHRTHKEFGWSNDVCHQPRMSLHGQQALYKSAKPLYNEQSANGFSYR